MKDEMKQKTKTKQLKIFLDNFAPPVGVPKSCKKKNCFFSKYKKFFFFTFECGNGSAAN